MRQIYLGINGQRVGPHPETTIQEDLATGRLTGNTLAWHEGLPAWVPVETLFQPPTPPAPPAQPAMLPASAPIATAAPAPSSLPTDALVRVDRVSKSFGTSKDALRSVTFAVPQGQICGLLGPNGAGKTTLFRLLMGILKATEGSLLIDGLDAFEERIATKRLIGFLPDEPVFYSYLSGREILELSAAMHGLDVDATLQRIDPLARQLRLASDLGNYAEDYSRGMKKKLGLLLALLHEPRLLILDEPTNGLDVESTQLFYEIVRAEAARGTTVLFSTHLMDHVARLCSHAVIINEGNLTAGGKAPLPRFIGCDEVWTERPIGGPRPHERTAARCSDSEFVGEASSAPGANRKKTTNPARLTSAFTLPRGKIGCVLSGVFRPTEKWRIVTRYRSATVAGSHGFPCIRCSIFDRRLLPPRDRKRRRSTGKEPPGSSP